MGLLVQRIGGRRVRQAKQTYGAAGGAGRYTLPVTPTADAANRTQSAIVTTLASQDRHDILIVDGLKGGAAAQGFERATLEMGERGQGFAAPFEIYPRMLLFSVLFMFDHSVGAPSLDGPHSQRSSVPLYDQPSPVAQVMPVHRSRVV